MIMDRGWIKLPRGLLNDPNFEWEPFTEREAFIWLMERAAYVPHTVTLKNGKPFQIQRGELLTSLRKMASEWGWKSDKRVRTFIKKLNHHNMVKIILAQPGTHNQTHIRLCNYSKIHNGERDIDAATDADRTQTGRIEKKDKEGKERKEGAARPPPAVDPPIDNGGNPDKYAWQGLVVCLTPKDYEAFYRRFCKRVKPYHRTREKFNEIIAGADMWFVGDDAKERKRWFFRLGQWIDREIEIKKLRPPHEWELCG